MSPSVEEEFSMTDLLLKRKKLLIRYKLKKLNFNSSFFFFQVAEILPVPKSVRFLRDGVKAPRLHSIQEEVGRAMEIMRMGTDQVYIKNPTASCNNLFERRRAVHLSIPRVYC